MDNQKFHIRVVILFFVKKGEKACKNTYDDDVGDSSVRRRFTKSETGELSLEDDGWSGKPSKLDEHILKAKIEENSDITTRELTDWLEFTKTRTHEQLVKLGYIYRYNVRVARKFSEKTCLVPHSVCDVLLKRNEIMPSF